MISIPYCYCYREKDSVCITGYVLDKFILIKDEDNVKVKTLSGTKLVQVGKHGNWRIFRRPKGIEFEECNMVVTGAKELADVLNSIELQDDISEFSKEFLR